MDHKFVILDMVSVLQNQNRNLLSSKKFDHIKIAFLLSYYGECSANQINYYLSKIFKLSWTNSSRVSALLNSRAEIFNIKENDSIKTYGFTGDIILNKTTRHNWYKKIQKFEQNPTHGSRKL
jgi:hypothetical protein